MPRAASISLADWPPPRSRSVINQRLWPRAAAPFAVRVTDRATWAGINLSAGGMLCRAAPPWWPGNEITAELMLPQEPPLIVWGRVAELVDHLGGIAMRVCFGPLDPPARGAIVRWIAARRHC